MKRRPSVPWSEEKRAAHREYSRRYRTEGPKYRRAYPNPASRSPSTTDIHWAAGFLEGEGCFAPNMKGCQQVSAAQVEWDPLVRLVQMFGGSVNSVKRGKTTLKCTPALVWRITGARARGVMMTLYPMMSPKRQQKIRECLANE
jgi:hypothetical protein